MALCQIGSQDRVYIHSKSGHIEHIIYKNKCIIQLSYINAEDSHSMQIKHQEKHRTNSHGSLSGLHHQIMSFWARFLEDQAAMEERT